MSIAQLEKVTSRRRYSHFFLSFLPLNFLLVCLTLPQFSGLKQHICYSTIAEWHRCGRCFAGPWAPGPVVHVQGATGRLLAQKRLTGEGLLLRTWRLLAGLISFRMYNPRPLASKGGPVEHSVLRPFRTVFT